MKRIWAARLLVLCCLILPAEAMAFSLKPPSPPQERFEAAKGLFEAERYGKALRRFRALVKQEPNSEYAPEALFYSASILEELGQDYKAFEEYQAVIDKYPMNQRLNEIVERQYLIGERLFDRKQYRPAEKVFQQVMFNAPYSKVADAAQFKLGLSRYRLDQFSGARDALLKIPENYSFSPYLDDASFYAALAEFRISSIANHYDDNLLSRAIESFRDFMVRFPTSEFLEQVRERYNKLLNVKAGQLYNIARFYEKQGEDSAAVKYYEKVTFDFGDTEWGEKARTKLNDLQEIGR